MGTVYAGDRFYRAGDDRENVTLPGVASVAISDGDLLYWDSSAKVLKPMDQFSATGTAANDRATLGAAFAGVCLTGKLAADASAGYPGAVNEGIKCAGDAFYEADCASATFEPGDKVSVVVNAGTGAGKVENLKVAKTTTNGEWIGYVVERYASATTKVRVRLIGQFSSKRART